MSGNWLFGLWGTTQTNAGPRFLNRVDTLTVLKILGQKCWEGGHSSDFATSHWQWHGDPKEYGRISKLLNLNVTCICIHVGPGSLIVSCRDHNVGLLARNSTNYLNALTWDPLHQVATWQNAIPLGRNRCIMNSQHPSTCGRLMGWKHCPALLNVTMHDALPMQIAKPRLASVGFIFWLNAKSRVSEQNAC